jgi:transposase
MGEKRRKFSSGEKVRILRRHLVDKVPLSDACDEYALCPTVFYRWQKMFFENGVAAFEGREDGRSRKPEGKLSAPQAKSRRRRERTK